MATGCGASLPKRFVLEKDLSPYVYRRYQHVLDVEFPVEGNEAAGHTATYIRRNPGSTTDDEVTFASAFVTVYKRATGLAAEVKQRVSSLSTYESKMVEVNGEHVWHLDGGGDVWLLWVSGNHVVKLGAPAGAKRVPEALVEAYQGLYPSDLNAHGRAEDGAPSAGPAKTLDDGTSNDEGAAMPKSLREGAPR